LGDFMIVPRILARAKYSPDKFAWLFLAIVLLLSNGILASCTGLFGGSPGPTATATPTELAIAQLHWCGKPSMLFRDEGAVPTPRTINDWSVVEANLDLTVFLPTKLPRGACLVNAQATIHDPIIGGSFTIGYLLPDHSAFTLSEAPLISQNTAFQCNSSNGAKPQENTTPKTGTPAPSASATQGASLLLCSGAKDKTNIVMSARGSTVHLQQIFNNLQPNVTWIPAS
jgi:hypothetical protein